MSRPADKLKLWIGQPVNAPFATPPIGLRVILILCIVSVVGSLGMGVVNQLTIGGSLINSASELVKIAFFYFVLPIAIATTISTNRRISRPLVLVYFSFIAYHLFTYIDSLAISPTTRGYAAAGVLFGWAAFTWWLYRSDCVRTYYSLISNQGIPVDLADQSEMLTEPGRLEAFFARVGRIVAPYLEFALILVGFIAIGYAVGIMDTGDW